MKNLTESSGYFQKISQKFRSRIFRFGVEFCILERNFGEIQRQTPVLDDLALRETKTEDEILNDLSMICIHRRNEN